MSNQMRKVLVLSLVLSILTLGLSLVVLFVSGGFINAISWAVVILSAILMVILVSLCIEAKRQEKELRAKIANIKLIHKLREKAIYDFYHKFGLKPQYNKDGKLLTPDEFLGIITKLDANGKLDPSVYEMLGIMPRFDENGKEIPQVLVLKHLIRAIKKEGFSDISKLKGLYKKGTKKEADKKPEKKKEAVKKEEKKAGGKKGKGSEKINLWGGKVLEFKLKENKSDGKKPAGDKKVADNKPVKPQVKPQEKKEEPRVEKVFQNKPANNQTSSYLNKMWNGETKIVENVNKNQNVSKEAVEEYGEGTFE